MQINMSSLKVYMPRFKVIRYDRRFNYMLWEQQVKELLKASDLGMLPSCDKDVNYHEWAKYWEVAISPITLHLQPHIMGLLGAFE